MKVLANERSPTWREELLGCKVQHRGATSPFEWVTTFLLFMNGVFNFLSTALKDAPAFAMRLEDPLLWQVK